MSNLSQNLEHDCTVSAGCDALKHLISPRVADLGGFSVKRTLPVRECRSVGPWVFFDHMGPAHFDAGQGIDVRPHPHIGLATVTYLFEGEILHRDSLGTEQIINPGEINLMVAGKGIVHSERQSYRMKSKAHKVHGLQLWLALPTEQEQCDPAFYHYAAADIPETVHNGAAIRVLIGSAYDLKSPVKTFAETLYLEASLDSGQSLNLPEAEELGVYVLSGELSLGESLIKEHNMAVFTSKQGVSIKAEKDSSFALIGGENLGKRYMDWNFVASDLSLIKEAKQAWRSRQFPVVPGDEEEFIPLPE